MFVLNLLAAADFLQISSIISGKLQYLNMKSNKGVLTILVNLAELILQARISPSPALNEHLDSLQTELALLRNQLLPSTEIVHFLVPRLSYNLKNKINAFLKTASLEQLVLTISFTVTNKVNSLAHVAEIWKLAVVGRKERQVCRESRAHQLLFLIGRLFEQLNSRELFSELIRNREASKKYIIDFEIQMKEQNVDQLALDQLGKMTYNCASLDNARQLQIRCYTNTKLQLPLALSTKKITNSNSTNPSKPAKNSLEATRGDSIDQEELLVKRRFISQENLLEVYDSELDLTILSSDSETWSPKSAPMECKQELMEQFELLIEQKDKDELFVQENLGILNSWQLSLLQNFI